MLVANPEKMQIFGFVVLFPLTFTSDAFVRTASMPGPLQAWAKANPVSLLADAARGLMVGGPVATAAIETLLYALGFTRVRPAGGARVQAPDVGKPGELAHRPS